MDAAAFTLIELLVVVSIITLLISILLPSLSAAREEARRIKWLDRWVLKDRSKDGAYAAKMARCPSDKGFVETPMHIFSNEDYFSQIYSGRSWFYLCGTSFAANYTTLRGGRYGGGYGNTTDFWELGVRMKPREMTESNATEAILYCDMDFMQLTWEVWLARVHVGIPNYRLRGWHGKIMESNVAFVDGHAERVTAEPDVLVNENQLDITGWPVRNRRWTWICGFLGHWEPHTGRLLTWRYTDPDPRYGELVHMAYYRPGDECR